MSDDLVERLRDFDPHLHEWEVVDEAADRIEALTAERDRAYASGYSDAETEISASALGQRNSFLHSQYANAADRIEALTAEVQRWQGLFDEKHGLMLEQKTRADNAEADNARLHDALEAMQQAHCKADLVHRGKVWRDVMKLINVALNTGKG